MSPVPTTTSFVGEEIAHVSDSQSSKDATKVLATPLDVCNDSADDSLIHHFINLREACLHIDHFENPPSSPYKIPNLNPSLAKTWNTFLQMLASPTQEEENLWQTFLRTLLTRSNRIHKTMIRHSWAPDPSSFRDLDAGAAATRSVNAQAQAMMQDLNAIRELWENIDTLTLTSPVSFCFAEIRHSLLYKIHTAAVKIMEAEDLHNRQQEEEQRIADAKHLQQKISLEQRTARVRCQNYWQKNLPCFLRKQENQFHNQRKVPEKRVDQKYISPDEVCPICLHELFSEGDEQGEFAYCAGQCGKSFHLACQREWLNCQVSTFRVAMHKFVEYGHQIAYGVKITCSQCRAPWAPGQTKAQKFVGDMLDRRFKRVYHHSRNDGSGRVSKGEGEMGEDGKEVFWRGDNVSALEKPGCGCDRCVALAVMSFSYCTKFLGAVPHVWGSE